MKCWIPARPIPTNPGEFRNGLRAETTAYEIISGNDAKKLVSSETKVVGGGFGPESEWVDFYVHIPLDSKELDAEARRYLAKLEASMTPDQKRQLTEGKRKMALEYLRQLIGVNRIGHFQVDCRVLDGTRVIGSDVVELEVLFEGSLSDAPLPTSPPAN